MRKTSLVLERVGAALTGERRSSSAAPSPVSTGDRDGHISLAGEKRRSSVSKAAGRSKNWFAQPLEEQRCVVDRGRRVPAVLMALRRTLEEQSGLEHEGLFRLSAEAAVQAFMRQRLEDSEDPEVVLEGCSCDVLAGLLKEYFRELPGGVWVSGGGAQPKAADKKRAESRRSSQAELEAELLNQAGGGMPTAMLLKQALGPSQREVLLWLLDVLLDVAAHEAANRMSKAALAAVFAPVLMPGSLDSSALEQLQRAKDSVKLCQQLLDGHERAFNAPSTKPGEARPSLTRGASKRKATELGDEPLKLEKRKSSAGSGGGSSTGLTPRLATAVEFS